MVVVDVIVVDVVVVDVVVVDVVVNVVVVDVIVVDVVVVDVVVVGMDASVAEGAETRSVLPHAATTNARRNMTASALPVVAGRQPGDPDIRMGPVDHSTSTAAGRLPNPVPPGP